MIVSTSNCLDTRDQQNIEVFSNKAIVYREIESRAKDLCDHQLAAVACQKAQSYDVSIYNTYQRYAYRLAIMYGQAEIADSILRREVFSGNEKCLPEPLMIALSELGSVHHLKPIRLVVS